MRCLAMSCDAASCGGMRRACARLKCKPIGHRRNSRRHQRQLTPSYYNESPGVRAARRATA